MAIMKVWLPEGLWALGLCFGPVFVAPCQLCFGPCCTSADVKEQSSLQHCLGKCSSAMLDRFGCHPMQDRSHFHAVTIWLQPGSDKHRPCAGDCRWTRKSLHFQGLACAYEPKGPAEVLGACQLLQKIHNGLGKPSSALAGAVQTGRQLQLDC